MNKAYVYPVKVLIGDTNIEMNVYWLNFLKWFGQAREIFIFQGVPEIMDILMSGVKMVTYETNFKHLKEAHLLDDIIVRITVGEIRPASARLDAEFILAKTDEILARGWQRIVFTDMSNKPIRIPDPIKAFAKEYLKS